MNNNFVKIKQLIRFTKFIICFSTVIGIFLPTSGLSQSIIKGNIFYADDNKPVAGCLIILSDSLKTDSIWNKILKNSITYTISDGDGNFEIININESKINLIISQLGNRNTIVKNIPPNNVMIELHGLPLLVADSDLYWTPVLNKGQRLKLKFRLLLWHIKRILGTVEPYTYKNEFFIKHMNKPKNKIYCKKTKFGVEIDYNDPKNVW